MEVSIEQAEALTWLHEHAATPGTSVVTSLPDRAELAGLNFQEWCDWFVKAAAAVIRWIPADGVAIFYQTDVRHDEVWVDKSHLILRAAGDAGAALVWHKIVCRRPPELASERGWPSYSHLLCLAHTARAPRTPAADVLLHAGDMSSPREMGYAACQLACDHLCAETAVQRVVDPFCGTGSVLAAASVMGFDVVGVDINAKRCRAARTRIARVRALAEVVRRGATLFDRGEFFEAHEVWEESWRASTDEGERLGLQGLIQAAATFHKLFEMRAPGPASSLLAKALDKLETTTWLPGVDVATFRAALRACAHDLEARDFDRGRVPRLLTTSARGHGDSDRARH